MGPSWKLDDLSHRAAPSTGGREALECGEGGERVLFTLWLHIIPGDHHGFAIK
jgi:hypothetical protein